MALLWLIESDVQLNTLKVIVDYAVTFFYPGESSDVCATPNARQLADAALGDHSHQYEAVSEPNSQDLEVPTTQSQVECGG
jgi:hypothetical protein